MWIRGVCDAYEVVGFVLFGQIMSSPVGGENGRAQGAITCLLERLGQEEALLHVVVRRVGGVDVLDAREAPAHPAVLVDGLQGVTRQAEDGGERGERGGEGMIKKKRERGREINCERVTNGPEKQRVMK